ncbi:hypothetical protein CMQ_6616 [Grosmannia clavigera kw1407]|uniref:Uncharacterized protein n=1 Tax=Grosmannia clavigera (strain kw1407 / UAMH 11150) TaxID=655863 RepID=F0X7B7_GROCL|nr:uncharacterized protein CMQ_6616 [Grosmannia clavigera kw1407]EFX06295.1 hypothetical protein CMQ_6616 [Grosmannia clavigera kw1407]
MNTQNSKRESSRCRLNTRNFDACAKSRIVAALADELVFPSQEVVGVWEGELLDKVPKHALSLSGFLNEEGTALFLDRSLETPAFLILRRALEAMKSGRRLFLHSQRRMNKPMSDATTLENSSNSSASNSQHSSGAGLLKVLPDRVVLSLVAEKTWQEEQETQLLQEQQEQQELQYANLSFGGYLESQPLEQMPKIPTG